MRSLSHSIAAKSAIWFSIRKNSHQSPNRRARVFFFGRRSRTPKKAVFYGGSDSGDFGRAGSGEPVMLTLFELPPL